MPAEPRRPTRSEPLRLSAAALLMGSLALGGCSRGTGLTEFATNLRDRVAGDAAAAEAERVLRPSTAETGGGGGGRPHPRSAQAGQPGQPGRPGQLGDQGSGGDGSNGSGGSATGSADANQPTKAPSPPVIYYYPTTPTPSAPSQ